MSRRTTPRFSAILRGPNQLLLEGLANQVAIVVPVVAQPDVLVASEGSRINRDSGHFAHRAIGVPLPPALQTAFSKR